MEPVTKDSYVTCAKRLLLVCSLLLRNHHFWKHNETKPFECEACEKKFKEKRLRDEHFEAEHKGTKSFTCNICDNQFSYRTSLKNHIKKEHSEKTEKTKQMIDCNVCNKSLNGWGTFQKHFKALHLENKYECTNCSMLFNRRDGLKRHVSLKHKPEQQIYVDFIENI